MTRNPCSFPTRLILIGTFLLASGRLVAVVEPRANESLHQSVVAPAGFVATVAPQPLADVEKDLDSATKADIASFKGAAGPAWSFFVDRRSGGMALVEGSGIPWIPGAGNSLDGSKVRGSGANGAFTVTDFEMKARAFIDRYPNLFKVPSSQLVLDTRGSVNFGENGHIWSIVFQQVVAGVPVDGARVAFRVSHGNLVQFGVDRTVPLAAFPSTPGPIDRGQARAALDRHVRGLMFTDRFLENGTLQWIPRGTDDAVGYSGPIGGGWQPNLVYRFTFQRSGMAGSWRALVHAGRGEVVRFVDSNEYASVLAKGAVYTLSNCPEAMNCDVTTPGKQPGNVAEVPITMPFALLNFIGGTCTGNGCYTNSAGAFSYPSGASAVSMTLEGKYFRIVDGCGAISAAAAAPNGLDVGTSDPTGPVFGDNFDCRPATRESPPNIGAVSGGAGDTHSARNTYYHLNLINQKARFYLPNNQWLKGTDGTRGNVIVNTNLPPACNAFWMGGVGTLNFEKLTAALFCNNTGELPDVFLHEFGHGLDQNDGTGTAPESATGEAMGDTFALLEGQHSCIGIAFRLKSPTNPIWGNTAGYGSNTTGSKAQLCSGVRDSDYTTFCAHDAAACLSGPALTLRDPDIIQGSRAGLTPPPNPPDAGTLSKYNTMDQTAPFGVADGRSNFYNCGGPETTGCAGPLNHGCHCESTIASQANFDLAKGFITNEFGGNIYASPQGPREVSGWQYMDRLWYLTRDTAVSAYSVVPGTPATTNGCGVSNWFSTYRLIDDNDGNLANGTPHGDIIFAAFKLHEISCGLVSDASNLRSGCPNPIPAPVLSSCAAKTPVQLSWTASAGATSYRILRNTLGCGFGFKPLAIVPATQLFYEDPDVAPGVAYYYSIQPVGANPSCYGQTSNCISVIPTSCAASPLPAPGTPTLTTPGPNQIQVSWPAVVGAASYKIFRKDGNCASANTYVAIATVTATTFLDQINIQGTFTYSYQIVASDSSCAACTSLPSPCASIQATGTCNVPPTFAGATRVVAAPVGTCQLTVSWNAGTAVCAAPLTYSVYRSTDPNFVPSPATLRASGLSGTSYIDNSVIGGTRYFYIVRATDSSGNTEGNTVRRNGIAVGTLTPGTFMDNAGDGGLTGPPFAQFSASNTINNTWVVRTSDVGTTGMVYATTPTTSPTYPVNACMGLESVTIYLGATPSLSFFSRYDMEQGWDGGYVEVSTEQGGYSDWTKLTTVNYPGVMAGPLGDPACGGPGFADGQPVFTGTSPAAAYATFTGSLSAYANKNIRIRFLFSSDSSTNGAGWFIDDIQVTGALIPGPCTTSAPTVTGITPGCANVTGGLSVTITGTNFQPPPGLTVTLVGTPATVVSATATSITATTGSRVAAPAVTGNVVVTNPDSQSGTLVGGFTYGVRGDANNSGALTPSDASWLNDYFAGAGPLPAFPCIGGDANSSGSLTPSDASFLNDYFAGAGPPPGP